MLRTYVHVRPDALPRCPDNLSLVCCPHLLNDVCARLAAPPQRRLSGVISSNSWTSFITHLLSASALSSRQIQWHATYLAPFLSQRQDNQIAMQQIGPVLAEDVAQAR